MSRYQDSLIEQATEEYERDGVVSVSTFVELAETGLDATTIVQQIEDNHTDG